MTGPAQPVQHRTRCGYAGAAPQLPPLDVTAHVVDVRALDDGLEMTVRLPLHLSTLVAAGVVTSVSIGVGPTTEEPR